MTETVRIPPSPRILKVLGDITMEPWQCMAELVDNSFDELIGIQDSGMVWDEPLRVAVSLPPASAETEGGEIVVRDNGRGMTLEQVRNAARAGWSSNDPFSKLGLFGMGFNVATARLGDVARILTTRAGDPDWVGLEIDLSGIGEDFEAPVIHEPKHGLEEHGTMVVIRRLGTRAQWLSRQANQRKLRETLGGVYSYLLDQRGVRLTINEIAVKPVRHCVWNPERSVTRAGEEIPAVIQIDEHLSDRAVCADCTTWQHESNVRCDNCGSDRLAIRERRIQGWIGIQRYLHQREYGIDFLRNGRKILRFDKSLFEWRDPDDPAGQGEVEYPIELAHQGGRIVGEIHIDHVPVTYLKNDFERSDLGWHKAVEVLRGRGPLLPKTAGRLGYQRNDSPLGRLHRGYRRNDPGRNYLVPGNGKALIDTSDWVRRFHAGDPEFQSDAKWWEAVVRHDEVKEQARQAKETQAAAATAAIQDPTAEFEISLTSDENAGEDETPQLGDDSKKPPALTERERIDALLDASRPLPELEAEYAASGLPGKPVKLTARLVDDAAVTNESGLRVPVWLAPQRGGAFAAFIDAKHPFWGAFGDDPTDLVLVEVAHHLITRAQGVAPPISAVVADLKDRYLSGRRIDHGHLVANAAQSLRDIQERMPALVSENPERPWLNALTDAERTLTSDRLVEALRIADVAAAIGDGTYLRFVPPSVVGRIVEEWPEAFFDGHLFAAPYAELSSHSARRQTVASVTGFLDDAAWLATGPVGASREAVLRARISLDLLPSELAASDA
jgi:hypothetical protein